MTAEDAATWQVIRGAEGIQMRLEHGREAEFAMRRLSRSNEASAIR